MRRRFPRLRDDGSFCVRIELSTASVMSKDSSARIADWLRAWVDSNQEWVWGDERTLRYSDDFAGYPFDLRSSGDLASFCMMGRRGAKWWRDWLAARLIPDLRAKFPEILGVSSILDCDEPGIDRS